MNSANDINNYNVNGISGQRFLQRDLPSNVNGASLKIFLLLIFIFFSISMTTGGYFYFQNYKKNYQTAVETQLSAVADQKVNEIVQWRKERLGDGFVFYKNEIFSNLVKQHLENRQGLETGKRLKSWLEKVRSAYDYDRVFMLDTHGGLLLSTPGTVEPVDPHLVQDASEIMASKKMIFQDFHRHSSDSQIYLAVMVPILSGEDYSVPLGVLVLRINPESFLYPLIQHWPTPNNTAETLLVQKDGYEVVFLNKLRFKKDAALNLKFPLNRTEMPAVQAALGNEGIMEGKDYRGEPVIACTRTIPDSPWSMVARMDTEEVFMPLKERLWMLIAFVSVLFVGVGVGIGLIWRQQRLQIFKERYKVSEAARAAEIRYREALDKMMEGCQIIGFDWRYLYVNDSAARHGKLTREDLLGHTMMEQYPGIEKTELFAVLKHCMDDRNSQRLENEFHYPDGTKGFFSLSIQPVPEGIFILSMDITKSRRVQEELERLNKDLDRRVSERTAQIEEANKELEAFSYSVSHDLRAPLRHINGYIDLLMKRFPGLLPEKGRNYLDIIADSAHHMGMLIDDLLQFSRTGRQDMSRSDLDMNIVLQDVLETIKQDNPGRNIEWDIATLPHVYGDVKLLPFVWTNLLSNAVKFTQKNDKARIEIGVNMEGDELIFFVRDNGLGFDMNYAHKLFGVFQRLHSSEEFEGTGIGLANVRRIIQRHGGRTWAESELNNGATFYFTLPAKKEI
jgi:PAS domain S-box-containing protein